MNYKTEQENFWAGEFGNEYIERNKDEIIIASNIALFSNVLKLTKSISTVIEFGANIGLNLMALKQLLPEAEFSAIEINEKAILELSSKMQEVKTYHSSILDFKPNIKNDFVLIKGVLIHINPEELQSIYETLYETSRKYICIVEYYNPSPVEVTYRGYKKKLFKRDFAGEILDKYSDVKLIDYGFTYHRDNNFPQDDSTWFLLEKE